MDDDNTQQVFAGWDVEVLPEDYQELLDIIAEQQLIIDMLREQLDECEGD